MASTRLLLLLLLQSFALSVLFTSALGQTQCPGEKICPSKNSCCKQPNGDYVCCPTVNATCCSDGIHCCPYGYECGITSCQKPSTGPFEKIKLKRDRNDSFDQSDRVERLRPHELDIVCPDGNQCPVNETCCLMKSGAYGCCPLPNAVYCKDGAHCCPNDYACQNNTCVDFSGSSLPSATLSVSTRELRGRNQRRDEGEKPRDVV